MSALLSMSGAAQQRVLRAMPDILQPTWLRETWAGEHGTAGLRADVTGTRSELYISDRGIEGNSVADGNVTSRDGRYVGTFTRDQTLHPNGRAEVHHSYMVLDESTHGTGYARSFNDRAFARYAAAGVDDVTIDAALTVGGYAWARQGFELVGSKPERALAIRELVMESNKLTRADRAMLEPWLIRSDGSLPEHALTSVQDLAAIPGAGRRALLGNSWEGQRDIPRTTAWWSKYDPASRMDAINGVSHLRTPELVEQRTQMAADAISNRMPGPLNHTAFASEVQRALGGNADVTQGALNLRTVNDRVIAPDAREHIDLPEGRVDVRIGVNGDRFTASEGRTAVPPALRSGLDSAYRSLGIATVTNGATTRAL